MLSARRALRRSKDTGKPLPRIEVFRDLYEGPFEFWPRGGEITVVAGHSGAFKSGLVLYWIAHFGVSALYVSADMAQHTAITRLVAALSGDTTKNVRKGLDRGAEDFYAEYVDDLPVRFTFNPNPDFADIQAEVDAWVETWDEYPQVIVLDNLMDIVPSAGDSEWSGYKAVLLDAKTLARETGAAVFVMHHASEDGTDSRYPAPKKKLLGKVSQTPENILSIAKEGNEFRVSVVKHRSGPDDPTGETYVTFRVFPESNTFAPWSLHTTQVYYQAEESE